MLSKVLYLMVFGALGGFLAWLVTEPFTSDDIRRSVDWTALGLYGAASGGFIGGMIGFATGLAWGTPLHMLRGALLGAGIGVVGGMVGVVIGQILFAVFIAEMPVVGQIVGRILGWGAFGAMIGLAEGVVARSPRRMYQGLLGGAIGGALGGALFDFLALTVGTVFGLALRAEGEVGAPSRAVALVLLGAGIGLFIGLIELIARQAWVRVLYGAREGKDYPIDRSGAIIGRDELADVPLRGDPTVALRHAEIQIQGGAYVLIPHAETRVNNQLVHGPVELNDGDQIQVGGFRMVFQLRAGEAVSRPRDGARSPLPPPPPVPAGACPYCGMRPDPITGACACTPVAAPSPSPAPAVQGGALTLVGLEGTLAGQRIPIPPTGLTIGREQDNTLIIPDPSVSRHHARIAVEGGETVLYDLGSTNGTFVNTMRITRHVLRRGDVVRFGGASFRVE